MKTGTIKSAELSQAGLTEHLENTMLIELWGQGIQSKHLQLHLWGKATGMFMLFQHFSNMFSKYLIFYSNFSFF